MDRIVYGLLVFSLLAPGCTEKGLADNPDEQNNTVTAPSEEETTGRACASGVSFEFPPEGPVDRCNVVWETPSKGPWGSMPIGNGDIGMNVWVEEDGDLLFYIGRSDLWSENGRLLKLGRVRVRFRPNLARDRGHRAGRQETALSAGSADDGDAA
jgi:hypothetical protein